LWNLLWTSLHFAVKNNQPIIVEYLIQHGADMDSKNIENHTPLHYASQNGNQRVADYLVNHGARNNY